MYVERSHCFAQETEQAPARDEAIRRAIYINNRSYTARAAGDDPGVCRAWWCQNGASPTQNAARRPSTTLAGPFQAFEYPTGLRVEGPGACGDGFLAVTFGQQPGIAHGRRNRIGIEVGVPYVELAYPCSQRISSGLGSSDSLQRASNSLR